MAWFPIRRSKKGDGESLPIRILEVGGDPEAPAERGDEGSDLGA
jgi:hypothetical protein